jgi:hypothetical protein
MSFRWGTRLLLATVTGLLVPTAGAIADPSARVARISFIGGSVSFRPASLDEWSVASLNYPLTVGDHVWTDRGARSELQLGSTVVRLAASTAFSVLNLDDHTAQLRLTQGAVSVRVRNLNDSDVLEIDTPNGAVSLLRAGLYRIDVNEAGDRTAVTVREGEADVAAGGSAFPLGRDQSVALIGVDAPRATVGAAVRIDDFEDWCLTRDRRADDSQAGRYVSTDMIGYEDLDANGTWQVVADYGPVWMPRVDATWVPYRFGRWAWVEPWGWTWVDDAPWGFAPFHYGRWAFLPARGWAWVPGSMVARPVYAPALVAFVGGSNWSASVRLGSGPVGWFPLGPREVFVPAYHVTPEYIQRINVSHVNVTNINVTNVTYVNRAVPGAITAVPRETFVQARPVATAAIAIPREQAQAAVVVGTAAPVAPQRASIAGPGSTRAPMPPQAAVNRQVVVRSTPPPPSVPFAAKQAALARNPGQPVDEPTENSLRTQTPNSHSLVRTVAAPRTSPANHAASVAPQAPAQATAAAGSTAPVARPAPSTALPELATRHAQERAEMDGRHAQERAALQVRHQQQQQAIAAAQRPQLQRQHQQEMKALQDRQVQERAALQKRQQAERKSQGADQK